MERYDACNVDSNDKMNNKTSTKIMHSLLNIRKQICREIKDPLVSEPSRDIWKQISKYNTDMLKIMVYNKDPETCYYPLHLACMHKKLKFVEFLIKTCFATDSVYCTHHHYTMLKVTPLGMMILDYDEKNINKDNYENNFNIIELLIEEGRATANGFSVDIYGQHLHHHLFDAMSNTQPFIHEREILAKYLIEKGANVNRVVGSTGETALHLFIMRKDLAKVEFLVTHGADLEKRNEFEMNALVMACSLGDCDFLESFISLVNRIKTTPTPHPHHNDNWRKEKLLIGSSLEPKYKNFYLNYYSIDRIIAAFQLTGVYAIISEIRWDMFDRSSRKLEISKNFNDTLIIDKIRLAVKPAWVKALASIAVWENIVEPKLLDIPEYDDALVAGHIVNHTYADFHRDLVTDLANSGGEGKPSVTAATAATTPTVLPYVNQCLSILNECPENVVKSTLSACFYQKLPLDVYYYDNTIQSLNTYNLLEGDNNNLSLTPAVVFKIHGLLIRFQHEVSYCLSVSETALKLDNLNGCKQLYKLYTNITQFLLWLLNKFPQSTPCCRQCAEFFFSDTVVCKSECKVKMQNYDFILASLVLLLDLKERIKMSFEDKMRVDFYGFYATHLKAHDYERRWLAIENTIKSNFNKLLTARTRFTGYEKDTIKYLNWSLLHIACGNRDYEYSGTVHHYTAKLMNNWVMPRMNVGGLYGAAKFLVSLGFDKHEPTLIENKTPAMLAQTQWENLMNSSFSEDGSDYLKIVKLVQ